MRHGDISNKGAMILAIDSRALIEFKKLSIIKKFFNARAISLNRLVANHVDAMWRNTDYSIAIVNRWDSGIDTEELKSLLEESRIGYSKIEVVKSEEELERLCEFYFTFYFYSKYTKRIPPKSFSIDEFLKVTIKKG